MEEGNLFVTQQIKLISGAEMTLGLPKGWRKLSHVNDILRHRS